MWILSGNQHVQCDNITIIFFTLKICTCSGILYIWNEEYFFNLLNIFEKISNVARRGKFCILSYVRPWGRISRRTNLGWNHNVVKILHFYDAEVQHCNTEILQKWKSARHSQKTAHAIRQHGHGDGLKFYIFQKCAFFFCKYLYIQGHFTFSIL